MIAHYFLARPIFASVISIIITLAGLIAIKFSAVEQYPQILPTDVVVTASYPSASPEVVATTVAAPLEQKINGVENMLYMRSSSTSNGDLTITVTFDVTADPAQAEIDVNNRVQSVMSKLPEDVKRRGVVVSRKSSSILQVITVLSESPAYDQLFISNYASINIIDALKRVEGIGDAALFGPTDYAMRIWLKPERLKIHNLTPVDVINAVREQNAQFAVGKFGDEPTADKYDLTYNVTTRGRFSSVAEFEDIIIKTNRKNGAALRLKDIATVSLGAQSYSFASHYDGKSATAIGVFLQSGANALATAEAVKAELARLSKTFPHGIVYSVPFDTTNFVKASIDEVTNTFLEAIILVMLVIYLFLQNARASAIPLLAIPVSLIGTFSFMYLLGFSINLLTLFGLILAIGIVVDDAIVVLENIERIMSTERLSPYQAARKAMTEVSGPIVAIVLALTAVFIPVTFIGGMSGIIYRQFAVTIVISIFLSGVVALTITPVLCVRILRRHDAVAADGVDDGGNHDNNGLSQQGLVARFFQWFNCAFERFSGIYVKGVRYLLDRPVLGWGLTAASFILSLVVFQSLPKGLVPDEDQGYVISAAISMPGTSFAKTSEVVNKYVHDILGEKVVEHTVSLSGYDILSSAMKTSSGSIFVTLKDWSQRKKKDEDARVLPARLMQIGAAYPNSIALAFSPPPIIGMSTTGGFEMYLQYKGGDKDFIANLQRKTEGMLAAAAKHPALGHVQSTLSTNSPQYYVDVDRQKAKTMKVSIKSLYETLQSTVGTLYVNDFTMFGRTYNVFVQGVADVRGKPEDMNDIYVRSETGQLLPVKSFLRTERVVGPDIIDRFNIFPAAKIMGEAAPGYSSGQALAAIEEIAKDVLSSDYDIGWTGASYQEQVAGGAGVIAFILGIIAVFLILAALYERWSLPFAVVASVPFAVLGAALSTMLRGLNNDIYFQVGIVTLIGLAAKNAILIVEFAMAEVKTGSNTYDAAVRAAQLRFRPIVMTSLAFILGCIPLAISSGPGSASRHAIGTGVIGGMLFSTVIAPFFIPLFFKTIMDLSERVKGKGGVGVDGGMGSDRE